MVNEQDENAQPGGQNTGNKSTPIPSVVPENLANYKIPCITADDEIVNVEAGLLQQSKTFRDLWKDMNITEESQLVEFKFMVKQITKPIFLKVVEWMKSHIGQSDPVVQEDPVTRERIWFTLADNEKQFFQVTIEELAELLTAGNFLDLKSMYLYGCQTMAGIIKDKSPEEVRELLGLEDDLTEEEKEEIRRKNVWCNY